MTQVEIGLRLVNPYKSFSLKDLVDVQKNVI